MVYLLDKWVIRMCTNTIHVHIFQTNDKANKLTESSSFYELQYNRTH